MSKDKIQRSLNRLPVWFRAFLFYIPLVIVGLMVAPDYGLAWDEPAQREIGLVSYNYIFHGDRMLHNYHDKDYGVGFELPLIVLEKVLGIEDNPTIFKMRHAASHLFFLFCLYCGFLLIYKLFGSFWLAATGSLFFILHPVLYAHSFFNTKDIPFMGLSLVCFLLLLNVLRKKRYIDFVLLGVCIGYVTNLRLMGLLLLGLSLMLIFSEFLRLPKSNAHKSKMLVGGLIAFMCFAIVLYLSWPYLYENPVENLIQAFKNMSRFRWRYEVLYLGEMIPATKLPWHYIPVNMSVTTPLIFLLLALTGGTWAAIRLIQKPAQLFSSEINYMLFVMLASVCIPIAAVIALQSVVYDSWRHLFFIYSPLAILGAYTLYVLQKAKIRFLVWGLIGLTFATSSIFMIQNHPHQHVYFNALMYSSKENYFRHHFEMDYWGVSYLEAIQAVLQLDSGDSIKVKFATAPGEYNVENMLPAQQKQRIVISEDDPKYFVTGYRYHPMDYDLEGFEEVHAIQVCNNTIVSVFRRQD